MKTFYDELASFADFSRLGESLYYRALPADWSVVISDIRGSTKAIEDGRYQDVNTLGAASIAAVTSVFPGHDIPFVFGGDGASFLVPSAALPEVRRVLLKLRAFARANYGMEMRVGAVGMSEVLDAGQTIEVAKFAIAEKKTIAIIRGGGLSFAENLIKQIPERYCFETDGGETLEQLTGLSCRWEPLPSKRGAVLSILIKPMVPGVLDEILNRLDQIFEGGMTKANPVNLSPAGYKPFWQILRTESKYTARYFSRAFAWRLISIALSVWAFRWGRRAPFDSENYLAQIPGHSDYRKFDDVLRMILDCSPEQERTIREYLESLNAMKKICYGIHTSPTALMTCLVENLQEGGHIHFIDGGDGGYAVAAKQLKEQLAKF